MLKSSPLTKVGWVADFQYNKNMNEAKNTL